MRILIDIGHPAHVHFFKNLIRYLEKHGHEVKITARRKEITFYLLNKYGLEFENLGEHKGRLLNKAFGMINFDIKLLKIAKSFKPDLLTGIGSPYLAQISRVLKKPSIIFTDSEPVPIGNLLTLPFAKTILTPTCFRKNLGVKQIRYNGYHELAYLHPNYFRPNINILKELGLAKNDKFFILRFVAWKASHDIRQKGFDFKSKQKLINELEKYGKVFMTSEKELPSMMERFRIPISPEKIHDLLFYATLLVGDTQTMTTEAALLGTPAVRSNSFVGPNDMGVFLELEKKYGVVFNISDPKKAIEKALELAQTPNLKKKWRKKRKKILKDKIDVTKFVAWFIENYPDSFTEMKINPKVQERFK